MIIGVPCLAVYNGNQVRGTGSVAYKVNEVGNESKVDSSGRVGVEKGTGEDDISSVFEVILTGNLGPVVAGPFDVHESEFGGRVGHEG